MDKKVINKKSNDILYEEFLDREYPVQLKLLYSNFTKGNQLMPYKNYQLKLVSLPHFQINLLSQT